MEDWYQHLEAWFTDQLKHGRAVLLNNLPNGRTGAHELHAHQDAELIELGWRSTQHIRAFDRYSAISRAAAAMEVG